MNPSYFLVFVPLREPDGQASGGKDFGSDDWIFTIRERDPKKLQNGASPTGEEEEPNKRPLSQSLSTVITPVLTELKEGAGDAAGATVKPEVLEQLGEAIFLAEEAYPGISDVMVTQLIQRLQRFSRGRTSSSSHQ